MPTATYARFLVTAFLLSVAPALTAAEKPEPLVDTQWLTANLDRDDVAVLDIRNAIDGGDRDAFEKGHIPSAVYSSYTADGWRTEENGVPGKLPPVPRLETLIGGLGIGNDDTVVIVPAGVGATDFGSAARVYWTFKVLGHDRVTILNGGHRAWVDAGGELERGWNEPEATTFEASFRPELLADLEEVNAARQSAVALVDSRPAPFFEGDRKHPAARAAGTIPGAVDLPHALFVEEGTAHFVDADVVNKRFGDLDVAPGQPIVTFCNTGHWASTTWFALSEIAGHDNVSMYDGSMVEWAADESRPLQVAKRGLSKLLDYFAD